MGQRPKARVVRGLKNGGRMSWPDGLELAREEARSWFELEWLETNALGSFAMACVDRKLRRKYHALLTVRDPGRGDAWNLLAETRELLHVAGESVLLSDPLAVGTNHDVPFTFSSEPHATHCYRLQSSGVEVVRSVRLGARDQVELQFRVRNVPAALEAPLRFELEPLLRCRPLHELTQENPFLDGTCVKLGDEVRMLPYAGMPAIALRIYGTAATFTEQGSWLHVGNYVWEAARGYPASESLFSPGRFTLDITHDTDFTFVVGLHRVEAPLSSPEVPAVRSLPQEQTSIAPAACEPLARAASRYFAESASHEHGLIAGYPWFSLRSRDALLALPGIYLATGAFNEVERVLSLLAKSRVRGLIAKTPAFAGLSADTPSVEASLLFAYTVQWFKAELDEEHIARFMPVVCELIESLAEGGDPRVRFDRGVGIFCEPGPHPLSWMDASLHGRPLTPRAGHAVELDALAYNAVHFACAWADAKRPGFARTFRNRLRNAEGAFIQRYWDDARGYLADTHDGELADPRLRPNQLWALALPYRPVSNAMARAALLAITRDLWTPVGLRTLSPYDPAYCGHYEGDRAARDRAYHQGSVWPWLTGIYADALSCTFGHKALEEHVAPILARMREHLENEGCVGQVSELFAGDAPHRAGGAPAFAVSAAELYRSERLIADTDMQKAPVESAVWPKQDAAGAAKNVAHSKQHGGETLLK